MTGFARAEGGDGDLHWTWELKSVNGRGLDIRCRLPVGFEALEPLARTAVAERCRRGNVSVTLTVSRGERPPQVRINRAVLDQLLSLLGELRGRVDAPPPRLEGLLAVRGVVDVVDEEALSDEAREARQAAMTASLGQALESLEAMRKDEGGRLLVSIAEHVAAIDRLRDRAAAAAASQPAALRARLQSQLQLLLETTPPVPEERLAQELAVLVTKSDVREELDRLAAHVAAARALLAAGGPIGRKLDFLCQEFNREANTLCAKAADVELTSIGLELKAAIEQLREQVQNIE
jgi:uncharacterized protein (TIGR00255 family)